MTLLDVRYGNPKGLPLELLLSMIPSLPRHALDRLVERSIDQMDLMDGDPDLEMNGDELDGSGGEDDFIDYVGSPGHPGCPVADPGGCEHDGLEPDSLPPVGAMKSREAHRGRLRLTRCIPEYSRRDDPQACLWVRGRVHRYRLRCQPGSPSVGVMRRRHPQLRRKRRL